MMADTLFEANIRIIRSDNRSEFTFDPKKKFYREHEIMHQTICVDTPQQNGKVKRKYRYILNVARALYFQANFLIEF